MSNQNNDFDASKSEAVANTSKEIASQMGHKNITVEHLLMALLAEKSIQKMLIEVSGEGDIITGLVQETMAVINTYTRQGIATSPRASQEYKEVFQKVAANVRLNDAKTVTPLDIMKSLMEMDTKVSIILKNVDIDPASVSEWIVSNADNETLDEESTTKTELDMPAHERVLRKYCVNFNEEVTKKGIDPVIGRESVIDDMIITISRRFKKNVILTGEPGTGKSAIAEGLASKIVAGDVPEELKNATVWELDSTAVVAGAKFRGDMEERMKNIIKALEKAENPILFIDEVHTIIGAGESSGGGMDMANILKPALARGKFKCIGATTEEEFRKYFEKDKAMVRRFKRISVEEPSVEMTNQIIQNIAPAYSEYHGVVYDEDALDEISVLADRYITNRFNPDKSIDVLDIAGAHVKIMNSLLGESRSVTIEDIQREVAKIAKIPTISVKEDETQKLAHLENDLKNVVYGQDEAITVLTDSVLRARAGLVSRNKTLGNYLLVGSSGVGKSEICKQLAETLNMKLLRIDMSEYVEPHSVSKLIGSPPGYVGYGDGAAGTGILINALEENPHCILLLDEIEKAHPIVYNLFLQVMDNGFVTSSSGKKMSAQNIMLMMTSNAGAASADTNGIGFKKTERSTKIMEAVKNTFTPEFRNRLSAIVKFNPLSKDVMIKIVRKFIGDLNHLTADNNVNVSLTSAAEEYLAEKGYDPKMGARPCSRIIDEEIKTPLSKIMLFGPLKNGGMATVDLVDGKLVVSA